MSRFESILPQSLTSHVHSYKQNKFNLLREQSEGYTKLTTDLFSSLGPSHSPSTGLSSESFDAVAVRAQSVWERVLSFIGCFDLDPNRALDVILDVFSVNLASHWQFFLALLACSPWAGGFEGIGSMGVVKEEPVDVSMGDEVTSPYKGKEIDEILRMAEGRVDDGATSGKMFEDTHVLAQVLGFKFGYYQVR